MDTLNSSVSQDKDLILSTVIVSTTYFDLSKEVDRIRAELSLRFVKEARRLGYLIVSCDGGSDEGFLDQLRAEGVIIVPQEKPGIGPARRQSIARALQTDGEYFVYTELEKATFLPDIAKVITPLAEDVYDFVLPRRPSLDSYPEFQLHSELFTNLYWQKLTGLDLDITFGPRAWKRQYSYLFLDYSGTYGDKWDSIFIPMARAYKEGLRLGEVPVSFTYPKDQTQIEGNALGMYDKRLDQTVNITRCLCDYLKSDTL